MPLEPADRKVLDDSLAACGQAKAATERSASRLDTLTADVGALIRVVERLRGEVAEVRAGSVVAVLDVDHPKGAIYLVSGCGSAKVWIRDAEQWDDLVNGFPWLAPPARWAGRTLAKIPTIGPDPDPPSAPNRT